MTSDKELFEDLDTSFKSKVKIGNDAYLEVKDKGIVSIESYVRTKLITEVLFVPEIDQNLLSIESQSDCKVQVVKTDNETEYISQKFNSIYEGAGIEHQLTTPYSPQENGVSERKNKGYEEAKKDMKWIEAMKKKLSTIKKNNRWELVEKPTNRRVIGVKLVFKTKLNLDDSVNKLQTRLVVKGYAQVYGIDFSETFAPVARMDTIKLLLAVSAQHG
ncbi:putative mitochondrial protein [Cucumis melo var. makuwa]|uniref:Mitochondrial protein n=1 Tax=Cucumis melo var. makuwa TaxID=1194695 RepID=A0A5D3D626_CUCMM|nr:putative mitochondrial protein [Cucumis melo var. makuwa]TYK18953.1 putative mitochondrial protein [Cucumis melo var. makuwa]